MNLLTQYHLSGLGSAFFVILSLTGLALQVKFIRTRQQRFAGGGLADERPTSTISLNRFSASYFGFYAMMVYGLCLERFNHYLVWPRALAIVLILAVLHAIMADRKSAVPTGVFVIGVVLFAGSAAIRTMSGGALAYSALVTQALIVMATLIFLQGAIHQVIKIRRAGRTGGLSLSMHQLFFVKDLFNVLFGVTMGFQHGWPLMMFNGISMVMQCVIVWHFHWAKTSPLAGQRRVRYQPSD